MENHHDSFPEWAPLMAHPDLFTEEQIRDYHEKGFCVIDNFLDDQAISELIARYEEIRKDNSTVAPRMLTVKTRLEDSLHLEKLEQINFDPVFANHHCNNPDLLRYVHGIVGDANLSSISTKFLVRPPGAYLHPAHQDWCYFYLDPTKKKHVVGTWIALEDADVENGCLFFVPGSHLPGLVHNHVFSGQEGLRRTGYRMVDPFIMKQYESMGQIIPVPVKKGQLVLFHPLVIHGAHPNNSSTRTRMVLTGHYKSADAAVLDSVCGSCHEEFAKDLYELIRQKKLYEGVDLGPPTESNLLNTMRLIDIPENLRPSVKPASRL